MINALLMLLVVGAVTLARWISPRWSAGSGGDGAKRKCFCG
jgi:hypothetical protein